MTPLLPAIPFPEVVPGLTYLRPVAYVPAEGPGVLLRGLRVWVDDRMDPDPNDTYVLYVGIVKQDGSFAARFTTDRGEAGFSAGLNVLAVTPPVAFAAGETVGVRLRPRGYPPFLTGLTIIPDYTDLIRRGF